jgi:type I restriction enzyme M protein
VILPFTILRRLDCVLAPTKLAVLAELEAKTGRLNPDPFLIRKASQSFYNTSPLDLGKLLGDQDHIRENLYAYIQGFSPAARDIFERFDFAMPKSNAWPRPACCTWSPRSSPISTCTRHRRQRPDGPGLRGADPQVCRNLQRDRRGALHAARSHPPDGQSAVHRGRRRADAGNAVVRTIYDPTAGTGGMLSVAGEYLHEHNPDARLTMFGQELNDESYAICKADMLIKGQNVGNIVVGNTLSEDGHGGKKFDYMLSNPPFGVEWKKVEKEIRKEAAEQGLRRPFRPGLPRVSDGSLLFLLHLISKMRPAVDGGSRIGIVLNGSPLFTGGAGSGESPRSAATCWKTTWSKPSSPANRHVLQHRHQHLRLDTLQQEADRPQRLGATHRRQQLLAEDAQEPGQQAQGVVGRPYRRHHPPVRRIRRSRASHRLRCGRQGSQPRICC